MTRFSPIQAFTRLIALLVLPFRAPLLLLLFAIAAYLGFHWTVSAGQRPDVVLAFGHLFWSIDCLHALLVVVVCTMPELLLQRVSALMAASRVASLVMTLLIVTVGGVYLLHLNVLSNVLILGSGVLLARLDLVRLRLLPPPWVTAVSLSLVVVVGVGLGRYLAERALI